jgi:N-acetylglucosamine-6-phosphate deacetylase
MASLTPAKIIGRDGETGSLTPGKHADVVVLDAKLHVKHIFIAGEEFTG